MRATVAITATQAPEPAKIAASGTVAVVYLDHMEGAVGASILFLDPAVARAYADAFNSAAYLLEGAQADRALAAAYAPAGDPFHTHPPEVRDRHTTTTKED